MKPNPFNKFLITQLSPSQNKRVWAIFTIVLIALILVLKLLPKYFECWYTNLFDPIISITTVAIAIYIWYFQQYNYWKESLPKRLTVHFVYFDKVTKTNKAILSCYEAYLAGASDVRAWSQQIGLQMTNKSQLDFYPYLNSLQPVIKKSTFDLDENTNKLFDILLYEVTFYLRSDEFKLRQEIKGKYIIWLDNNPVNAENIELPIDYQPNKPFTIEEAIAKIKS